MSRKCCSYNSCNYCQGNYYPYNYRNNCNSYNNYNRCCNYGNLNNCGFGNYNSFPLLWLLLLSGGFDGCGGNWF